MKKLIAIACLLPAFSHAAHPLVTDDTGTQGTGGMQLELNADASRDRSGGTTERTRVANATFTYGLTEDLDLALNLPHQRAALTGTSAERGTGDVALGLKWRFLERDGFTLGLKPQVLLATGNEQRGLGNGKPSYGASLLAAWEADTVTLLANAGYTYNNNTIGARKNLWNLSAAALYRFAPKFQGVFDVGTYRNVDPSDNRNPAFAILGMIYSPTESVDFDIGFRKGLNKTEADKTAGVGLTLRW